MVACRDFTATGLVLQDFTSMKNAVLDSDSNGTGTEPDDITETIETHPLRGSKTPGKAFLLFRASSWFGLLQAEPLSGWSSLISSSGSSCRMHLCYPILVS